MDISDISEEIMDRFLDSPCSLPGWSDLPWKIWMADCLYKLFEENECFSGKRPNCDSGWPFDLAIALSSIDPSIVISTELDENCNIVPSDVDYNTARKVWHYVLDYVFVK